MWVFFNPPAASPTVDPSWRSGRHLGVHDSFPTFSYPCGFSTLEPKRLSERQERYLDEFEISLAPLAMSQTPWKTKQKRVVTGCPTWQVESLRFFTQSHPGRWVTNIGHHFQRGALCSPLHTKRGITIREPLVNTPSNSQTKICPESVLSLAKCNLAKLCLCREKRLVGRSGENTQNLSFLLPVHLYFLYFNHKHR